MACLILSLHIRGHCVADLDPLGITEARHADTEEEARSKFLATYRYHTVYNIGKVAPSSMTCRGSHTTDVWWTVPPLAYVEFSVNTDILHAVTAKSLSWCPSVQVSLAKVFLAKSWSQTWIMTLIAFLFLFMLILFMWSFCYCLHEFCGWWVPFGLSVLALS